MSVAIEANLARRRRRRNGKVVASPTWYMRFRRPGEVRWSKWINLGVRDKQVAEEKRSAFIREMERELAGISPPKKLREAAATALVDLLKEYCNSLRGTRDSKYVYNIEHRARRLFSECEWSLPRHVSIDDFVRWRTVQKKQAKTLNDYLADVRGFIDWLCKLGRVEVNVLRSVDNLPVKGRESDRRALTPDEVSRLLAVESGHRTLYAVALATGLRRAELGQLLWSDVNLDLERPCILASASITKNGKRATCWLPPGVAGLLEADRAVGVRQSDRVFPKLPGMKAFRADLEKAGIDHKADARGRKVVFHSLRHTLNTDLGREDVAPAVAMQIMRHSDLKLTMRRYLDAGLLPTRDAVMGLSRYRGTHQGTTESVKSSQVESGKVGSIASAVGTQAQELQGLVSGSVRPSSDRSKDGEGRNRMYLKPSKFPVFFRIWPLLVSPLVSRFRHQPPRRQHRPAS